MATSLRSCQLCQRALQTVSMQRLCRASSSSALQTTFVASRSAPSRGSLALSTRPVKRRKYATEAPDILPEDSIIASPQKLTTEDRARLHRQRNIGISAHIDSGKTTLTERVLFYTGRIKAIHEVKGKDQVGAKMDSMELEREKGITIQSAATFCDWSVMPQIVPGVEGDYRINIIDTPGHVDFTIEVERALRVLDGAVLVLCAVSGVQSQTITVDRQMKRYKVPRVAFINKMDRAGANPFRVINQIRTRLAQPCAALQVPIGLADEFEGVFDLLKWKAIRYTGENGMTIEESDNVSPAVLEQAKEKRAELIETLADVDETIGDLFLEEKPVSSEEIFHAVRRATVARRFVPVYLGSALANMGVQSMLDGVCNYLPAPYEVDLSQLIALNVRREPNTRHELIPSNKAPLVALAFKLEEGKYGQLTYMRVYQGMLKKGSTVFHVRTGKKTKLPKLVRMHSDEMEEIDSIGAGEICAVYGIDCASGDTFTDGETPFSMTSMYVPDPVVSLAVRPRGAETPGFARSLSRFVREDPTFRVHVDHESGETIISGMGELHLEIYVERMRREYAVDVVTGKPQVNYRETITEPVEFSTVFKRQVGGAGAYAKVVGRLEPFEGKTDKGLAYDFANESSGGALDKNYIVATRKGYEDGVRKGELIGCPVQGVRMVITDGNTHPVDSSENAFRTCGTMAFVEAYGKAKPIVLEPIMRVDVTTPTEYQGEVVSTIANRRGNIVDTEVNELETMLRAEIGLGDMFGYISSLRAATQGKGEFSMQFLEYRPVTSDVQQNLMEAHRKYTGGKSQAGNGTGEKRRDTAGKQGALRA